jgi:limonene 1,2-monooxygenase
MVLLDHLTKGRAMLGVGPGALGSDAYMLGIDALAQRQRMDESLGMIKRLLTETEPITYESDWFVLH